MRSRKKQKRVARKPLGEIPSDAEFRRPTNYEMEKAFAATIRRHGETLRALGDASELSKPKKKD